MSEKARIIPVSVSEKVVYEKVGETEEGEEIWLPQKNKEVPYLTLYFPKYWNPDDFDNEYDREEARIGAGDGGNVDFDMGKLNKMIELFDKYLPGYRSGEIREKEFISIVQQVSDS